MQIPDEIYKEAQISGVLGGLTNEELMQELRLRGVTADDFYGFNYALDAINDHRVESQERQPVLGYKDASHGC